MKNPPATLVRYNGGNPDSWRYDVMGDRSNAGETWVYDGLNRLVSRPGVSYQHDWLGNRLSDNLWTYRWDGLNRLVGMSPKPGNRGKVWSYVYRGDGLRVKRVSYRKEVGLGFGLQEGSAVRKPVWETDYLYDGQMPVCEQDYEDGVLKQTRVNFLGARGIEAVITIDHTRNDRASLQWLFYDGHGNVVRTMSNDGLFRLSAFQWRGVWGERESDLGLGRGYCANLGHPEDETGLVYMRARYYEPLTGRFISEDPSRDGVNWYLYADGNPVNKVDFEGQYAEWSELMRMFDEVIQAAWRYIQAGDKIGLEREIRVIERIAENMMRRGQRNFEIAVELRSLAEALTGAGGSLNELGSTLHIEAGNYAKRAAKEISTAWNLKMLASFLRVMMEEFSLN